MMDDGTLMTCGCCAGLTVETPVEVWNRPGLSAISYRTGTYTLFRDSMLARLSASEYPALHPLSTRADNDFSIALIDLWALLADILTFYQERIANESYLRTAQERLSVQQLARLIGYQLRPGVGASTYLAFTLQDPPAIPALPGQLPPPQPVFSVARRTAIDIGTRVQSVPGPGEQPQTFETIEAIEAHVEWNALRPLRRMPHPITTSIGSLTLQGLASTLQQGDAILLVVDPQGTQRAANVVASVRPDATAGTTLVTLQSGGPLPGYLPPAVAILPFPTGTVALTDEVVRTLILPQGWKQADLLALAAVQKWSVEDLQSGIDTQRDNPSLLSARGAFSFGVRAAVFGHNAPLYNSLSSNLRFGDYHFIYDKSGAVTGVTSLPAVYPTNWEGFTLANDSPGVSINTMTTTRASSVVSAKAIKRFKNADVIDFIESAEVAVNTLAPSPYIYLDGSYPGITAGGWVLLENKEGFTASCKVLEVAEMTRTDYAMTAKVTRLKVDDTSQFGQFKLRETTVLAQSKRLDLAPVPIPGLTIGGSGITLDGAYLELKSGQHVALTGQLTDPLGLVSSELLTIDTVTLVGGFTALTFKESLAGRYLPDTVGINANVALATHGETTQEMLGSGDGTAFQTFALRQSPLTYTQAGTATGAQSTLEVRVDNVRWHEVDTLYGHGPGERVFITRTADNGATTIEFGDQTARPPSGQDNVQATYRKGTGVAGRMKAHQLSLLLSRALAVRAVENPVATEGGDDPEPLERARLNAPLPMLTLDRIVSLEDYEDFARAYAGVAKSLATWTWDGRRRGVFVTVAGPDGAAILPNGIVYTNLLTAMQKAGDPTVPLRVQSYRQAYFQVAGTVRVDPDYETDLVLAAVRAALRSTFSFETRTFGQAVARSEVIATMQAVAGVVAVNLTQFHRSNTTPDPVPPDHLIADVPQPGADASIQAAELLILDPAPLTGLGAGS